eukprot:4826213-Amphidinium_carterae.1
MEPSLAFFCFIISESLTSPWEMTWFCAPSGEHSKTKRDSIEVLRNTECSLLLSRTFAFSDRLSQQAKSHEAATGGAGSTAELVALKVCHVIERLDRLVWLARNPKGKAKLGFDWSSYVQAPNECCDIASSAVEAEREHLRQEVATDMLYVKRLEAEAGEVVRLDAGQS